MKQENSKHLDKLVDSENLNETNSLPKYNMLAKEFPDECTSNGKNFKCKVKHSMTIVTESIYVTRFLINLSNK